MFVSNLHQCFGRRLPIPLSGNNPGKEAMKRMEEEKKMAVAQAINVEMFNGKYTALTRN